MESNFKSDVQPFDSFTVTYSVLAWTGIYRLIIKPKSQFKHFCHQIYRPFSLTYIVLTFVRRLIYIAQSPVEDTMLECLLIALAQLNLIVKIMVLNLGSSRLERLHDVINDPVFAANNKVDEDFLRENTKTMHRLTNTINIILTVTGIFWSFGPIFKRMQDETTQIPAYFPFETTTWMGFTLALLMEAPAIFWAGHGHLALDVIVAVFYAQATVQLKIIKYTKEVVEIFKNSIGFQFLSVMVQICIVIQQMNATTFSVQYLFYVGITFIMLTQVFLYCYYGGQVQYESAFVNDALYRCEWSALSPKFRRMLLIAMPRWMRPITPSVLAVIPLSLPTFLLITRTAYTLYTVLKTSSRFGE